MLEIQVFVVLLSTENYMRETRVHSGHLSISRSSVYAQHSPIVTVQL